MLSKVTALGFLLATTIASSASAQEFELTSTTVSEGAQLTNAHVFEGFGCEGENQSPQLSWTGAPEGTRSFAITAYDPDAPTGSGWWHWNVVNLPASTSSVSQNASINNNLPGEALEIRNDYGAIGFGGACPPPGEVHRYIFTVYALGTERLELPEDPSNALVGFMIHANMLDSRSITAVYNR
ncbi:YbhB/YbcL family Raf kinase inhibitor-like protein [Leptolyngbya cf. ectocarpi LEGE 11479]|uniref:YbhB/YbcL family Raf kinase inhibitor-like protein n=1 Tax=Leptolyngbya cf. ectocarpi LEGE 11479 TaxID=1828722 RepID=A0A928ZQ39_LEPEC|nr:YbhB/YbcL family Raf kinase inhibitor-like protein [Leptolyngbya ectocarpi]MBE9065860.1 YbhB/YbcL family Raf kinase inhibitor-like protein [Leptolyngbya cf. ectocarpi LEGE 11479]